jgi:hypothetical protein
MPQDINSTQLHEFLKTGIRPKRKYRRSAAQHDFSSHHDIPQTAEQVKKILAREWTAVANGASYGRLTAISNAAKVLLTAMELSDRERLREPAKRSDQLQKIRGAVRAERAAGASASGSERSGATATVAAVADARAPS